MNLIPTLLCDFYKIGHRIQYPEGTEVVYSTWTPRSGKHLPGSEYAVTFGMQYFIKEFLIDFFNKNFFERPKEDIIREYRRYLTFTLGAENAPVKHIEDLHDLGYLPLEIRALPEGTKVPFRVPMATVHNTDPRFFWLTNYFETLMSAELWKASTTATIASMYRKILDKWAITTTGYTDGVEFQGHDFSMRGMSGVHDAAVAGMGHLLSFVGTDTIPAIMGLEQYYGADIETELVGTSVNATEHSVMCAGGKDTELETFRRLITEVYPSGIVSIVSDTWDLWHVLTETLPTLRNEVLAREGKVVIRPDSGNPADIICGTKASAIANTPQEKGVIELLWDTFGGDINPKGYKVLNPAIGAIYGDSITLDLCEEICRRLEVRGFASTNVVFGIGSYTYQYLTRDTLGYAMKSTLTVCKGKEIQIFKDPVTDDGVKKSAKGRVAVQRHFGQLIYKDELSLNDNIPCLLEPVFKNGVLLKEETLSEIRERLAGE